MTKEWIANVFGRSKPIIDMCHLNALPGDPYYDRLEGMRKRGEAIYRS